ncbi:phage antirepressor [Parabacteroides sp. APC149_11_2_Y6]
MNIQVFKNKQFGEARVVELHGNPMFVGSDVAGMLGYQNTRDAISKHIDEEDKATVAIYDGSQNRNVTVINESGFYSLVLSSKLPGAKQIKRWVTSEVLPSIRKDGGYIVSNSDDSESDIMAKALLIAQSTIEKNKRKILQLEEENIKQAPKVLFANAVSSSCSSILIGDLAKLIRQNGIETGQRRLFEWMRCNGYLIRQTGESYNMPTQRSMEQGLMEIKETVIAHSDGHTTVSKTVKITGKGQVYFVNKFLKNK